MPASERQKTKGIVSFTSINEPQGKGVKRKVTEEKHVDLGELRKK